MQLELNNEVGRGGRTLERLESVKASWEWKVFSWEGSISSHMRTPNDLATVHGWGNVVWGCIFQIHKASREHQITSAGKPPQDLFHVVSLPGGSAACSHKKRKTSWVA